MKTIEAVSLNHGIVKINLGMELKDPTTLKVVLQDFITESITDGTVADINFSVPQMHRGLAEYILDNFSSSFIIDTRIEPYDVEMKVANKEIKKGYIYKTLMGNVKALRNFTLFSAYKEWLTLNVEYGFREYCRRDRKIKLKIVLKPKGYSFSVWLKEKGFFENVEVPEIELPDNEVGPLKAV